MELKNNFNKKGEIIFLKEKDSLFSDDLKNIELSFNDRDSFKNKALLESIATTRSLNKITDSYNAKICLALLESYVVASEYHDIAVDNLQSAYRFLYSSVLSLNELPQFEIVVPTAHRPKGLSRLVQSIQQEINKFGYPHHKVKIHIFNDGNSDISGSEDIDETHVDFEIIVWNLKDQMNFLCANFELDILEESSNGFFHSISKVLNGTLRPFYRGPAMVANIAKLILSRYTPEDSLVWFLDDDEEFAILNKKDDSFEIKHHTYSIFHAYSNLFLDNSIDVATGKCVGDPPFAGNQMLKTAVIDQLNVSGAQTSNEDYYNENLAYLDLDIFSRKRHSKFYQSGYPVLPYIEEDSKYFSTLLSVIYGHHPTRPISYHPKLYHCDSKGNICRNLGYTGFLYPGNIVYRRAKLGLLSPFAQAKTRINGAIFGHFLEEKGIKVSGSFIPIFHRRLSDLKDRISEFRVGVNNENGAINFAESWVKQIEGYIIPETFKRSKGFTANDLDETFHGVYEEIVRKSISNL